MPIAQNNGKDFFQSDKNEQAYMSKIRQAQLRQQVIFQQHLQKYTVPMSLQKIIDQQRVKADMDKGY